MSAEGAGVNRLLNRMDQSWQELQASIEDLTEQQLTEPGTLGEWSVRDIMAHVTTWEEQALRHLPVIMQGGRPPKYIMYGGIDAFNARMTESKRGLPLAEVRRQMDDTHTRLRAFVGAAPPEQLGRETRARRRLRLDTYGHYALHAQAIREWRAGR